MPFSSNALRECLLAGARIGSPTMALAPACCGVAWAWPWAFIRGGQAVKARQRGRRTWVQVAVGVDVGQGSTTIMAQIAAEALGVPSIASTW